jgi:hypothetical protein
MEERINEGSATASKLLNLEESVVDKKIDAADVIEKEVAFDFDKHIEEDSKVSASVVDVDKPAAPRKKAKKVDINNVSIVDGTALDKDKDLRAALFGGKSAFQIVAAQSGYMAKVIPLVHKDTINLLYSNLSRYEYRKAVYKVIFDKIVSISSEKMTFEEWLKNTTVEDIETFYYGVYCATFPNEGTFTFTCPECGEETTMKIGNNNLFKTTDKAKMKKLINEVSKNALSPEARKKYSLVGKTESFQLTDSKIIMELRTPSLWDSLEILRVVPERIIDKDTVSVTNMLYIKRFLIPSKIQEGSYTEQTDSQELLNIIDNLSIDDANELQDAVSERVDENRITYSIKNITCPKCKHEVKETPISIEDILFTQIFEKAQ